MGWICRIVGLAQVVPLALLVFFPIPMPAAEKKPDPVLGQRMHNFVLPGPDGKQVGLADFKDDRLVAVVFLGTACPVSKAYIPTLNEIQKTYASKKVKVVGIYPNQGDSKEAIATQAKDFKIDFPLMVDAEQAALNQLGAARVCEVFLLDERRVVRYHGRIDDQIGYDYRKDEPKSKDLVNAMEELLAGKKVTVASTETAGCLVTLKRSEKTGKVNFAEHVAPILYNRCAECHHPGTAAPFSLLTYDDAKNWSAMIREVVGQRRMPPWHADQRFGSFHNERRLGQNEIDTLVEWAASGAPKGDMAKAPKPPSFVEGWRIGKPDVVFQTPKEFEVPAKGTVRYKYFMTKTGYTEDKFIQAAEIRPGNRAVVHHIIVLYREAGKKQPVWIAATAPGAETVRFPEGLGRKIPAGADLIWQIHYTPNGKEEVDRSEIGLIFCKEPPKKNVTTFGIQNNFFMIPPGANSYEVQSFIPLSRDAVVLAFFPHMHLRGKDFEYQAHYPDGKEVTLLSVPHYDFGWQSTYRLKEPLHLPKGTLIKCLAHFDNSAANPANPDPKKPVFWGEQTWEEMMIGYIDFYYVDNPKDKVPELKPGA